MSSSTYNPDAAGEVNHWCNHLPDPITHNDGCPTRPNYRNPYLGLAVPPNPPNYMPSYGTLDDGRKNNDARPKPDDYEIEY